MPTNKDFLLEDKLTYTSLVNQTNDYLVTTYNRFRDSFTPASPFGQILQVLQNLTQLVFFYIEDALVELNIYTAFKEKSIYGLARLAGHNPTRAIAARGSFQLSIKPGAQSEVQSPWVIVNNNTKLTNLNTGLTYLMKVDNVQGQVKIDLTTNDIYKFRVVQGEVQQQAAISNGRPLQSYNFTSDQMMDNDQVEVYVNGEQYAIVDSLYDMTNDEKACIVKTGINDGIDVYFGNEDFGTIPGDGYNITVQYLVTAGIPGNLYAKSDILMWKFNDKGSSNIGEEIDLNEVFNVGIDQPFVLGAPGEDLDLTRLIAPKTSRALVLANPDNYVAFLSRFDYSYVNAYTTFDDNYIDDDNVVYLFIIPNVQSRLSKDTDYYTTDESNFFLTSGETTALYKYIQQSGRQIVSTELSIVEPTITKYALNIVLRIFDGTDIDTLRADILALLAEYFLRVQRRDKIPKSDIIAMIETVSGVDSVNIDFVSEQQETAIRNGFYWKNETIKDPIRLIEVTKRVKVPLEQDTEGNYIPPNPALGLDKFGDIEIGLNQLPLIRGGWKDRNSVEYKVDIKPENISSVNIMVDEVLSDDLSAKIMTQNKNILINNERKKS